MTTDAVGAGFLQKLLQERRETAKGVVRLLSAPVE
jgi:hypothetical protein